MKILPCQSDDPVWTDDLLTDPHTVADKACRVRAMFGRLAPRYDLANRVTSLGRDRAWRRAAVRAADPHPGDAVLDVACGTGQLAAAFVRRGVGNVVGLDASRQMLAVARHRFGSDRIRWVQGDGLDLPFASESFDIVSIAFGLRNFVDTPAGLAEMCRVVRPGGRVVVLEFAPPPAGIRGWIARQYVRRIVPLTGRILFGDRTGGYKYLSASMETYLENDLLRQAMTTVGLSCVRTVRRFALGTVAIHVGVCA